MKGIVGDWNRLVQAKQLFRVHVVVFGVISEQRAAGAGCVGEGIDESANGQHGETDPRHYLEMSYTSSPATRPCHTPWLSDKSCPVPPPGDVCTGDINVKTLLRGFYL